MSSVQSGGPSSIDMSQFYQVFFEEAQEHLGEMESLLLSIDPAAATSDELNAIFRAAHSIKGGSGTFGFTDMTAVTHELESLLDKVRKNELPLTLDMVDALLVAGDVLKAQLARHRGQSDEVPDAESVCERIRVLMIAEIEAASPGSSRGRELSIAFPVPGGVVDQAAFDDLASMLAQLGELLTPFEGDGDMRTLRFRTEAAEKEVRNLFAFVCETDAVVIEDTAQGAQDQSYGFFDSEPAPVSKAIADDSFGFFDDVPGVPAAAPAVADESYGFFTDVPAAAGVAAAP
ncbi:MAG TPA: Hpt domain-containing protein, partial [Burkholderiales bacterium]